MHLQKEKKYIECSFTVEAAFIFPIISAGLIACIWLCFYLYNHSRLMTDAELAADAGAALVQQAQNPERGRNDYYSVTNRSVLYRLFDTSDIEKAQLNRYIEKLMTTDYMAIADVRKEADFTRSHVGITLEMNMFSQSGGLLEKLFKDIGRISCNTYRKIYDRAETGRLLCLAVETVSSIDAIKRLIAD